MLSLIQKIKSLPNIGDFEDRKLIKKLRRKSSFTKILVDIFDDNLWSSKISFFVNSFLLLLVLLSSLEIIIDSEKLMSPFWYNTLQAIDLFTTIIFTIELFLRLYVARFYKDEYQGFWGIIRYFTSFYAIIDLLAILPFYLGFFLGGNYDFMKILRTLRIWRIVRYAKSVSSLINAAKSKGQEILVSLLSVVLLATTISSLIYYAEVKSNAAEKPESVMQILIWSLAKYTGDYAGIAEYKPLTFSGQMLATLNGLLGLAIFAVPAGLLGSAFIDELNEAKIKKDLKEKADLIIKQFNYGRKEKLKKYQIDIHHRYLTFDAIISRNFLSEEQIIASILNSNGKLIIRAMKSSPDVIFNDIKIAEYFPLFNRSYGACVLNPKSNVFIIDGVGGVERGIAHFDYAIAHNLGYNYIARLKRIFLLDGTQINSNYEPKYYGEVENLSPNEAPIEHLEFFEDIQEEIAPNDWVFWIVSGNSSQEDIIVEYGRPKDTPNNDFKNSTIQDTEKFLEWENNLKKLLANTATPQFPYATHKKGNYAQGWAGRTIHRLTKANVVTIYINIKILIGEDAPYYSLLKILITSFKETFGSHKEEIWLPN